MPATTYLENILVKTQMIKLKIVPTLQDSILQILKQFLTVSPESVQSIKQLKEYCK
jgi:hypothetical protein